MPEITPKSYPKDVQFRTMQGSIKLVQSGQTIQGVIDSITDAAADNPYVVMVPPGYEDESYTPISHITIIWVDNGANEIIQATTDTLTAAEVKGTIINNYGQSAANTQTLPAASMGLNALFVLSTIGNAFHVDVQAGDKFYLDGVALDNGDKISCSTPVVGDRLSVIAVQTGASSYDWLALSIQGIWTDGGA